MDKSEYIQIKNDVRAQSKKKQGDRLPCYVCGKHRLITENHHLIPVATIAEHVQKNDDVRYPMPMAWLCPNHHAYWHLLEKASKSGRRRIFEILGDESSAFLELLQIRLDAIANFYSVELPDEI